MRMNEVVRLSCDYQLLTIEREVSYSDLQKRKYSAFDGIIFASGADLTYNNYHRSSTASQVFFFHYYRRIMQ